LGLQIAAAIPVVSSMVGIYSGNNSSGAATVSSDNQKPDSQKPEKQNPENQKPDNQRKRDLW
jgi:hypothetical protein